MDSYKADLKLSKHYHISRVDILSMWYYEFRLKIDLIKEIEEEENKESNNDTQAGEMMNKYSGMMPKMPSMSSMSNFKF